MQRQLSTAPVLRASHDDYGAKLYNASFVVLHWKIQGAQSGCDQLLPCTSLFTQQVRSQCLDGCCRV